MKKRIGIFGWGVVAPKSPNIKAFQANLAGSSTWLTPFTDFGPSNFLVGTPDFSLADYRPWIAQRFSATHYMQLEQKMDVTTLFALGAFIQSLGQNPGIEQLLQELGTRAHVYIGTSLGCIPSVYNACIAIHEAQRRWQRFWAQPEHNSLLAEYRAKGNDALHSVADVPVEPSKARPEEAEEADNNWNKFWASRSPELHIYLAELAKTEQISLEGDIEKSKRSAFIEKERRYNKLRQEWGAPELPWKVTSAGFWNLSNTPAGQVSITGKITGMSFAPTAACSSFGVALGLAVTTIRSSEAVAVVVGAADPPPHRYTVSAFYGARVASCDGSLSLPLANLQGTHIAGGAAIWIVCDYDYMVNRGFTPLGMEILSVGLSSDADHLITPSSVGPKTAIQNALTEAGIAPEDVGSWDLHATATPGDYAEVATLRSVLPESVLITARKGTFGHGLGVSGGWELTAQHLAFHTGHLFPTPLQPGALNSSIATLHKRFVYNTQESFPARAAGKLSMGLGGINACVISRPWEDRADDKKPPQK